MTNNYFEKKLERYRNQINNKILNELSKREPKSLYAPLIYFLSSGGKRLRAISVLLAAKSVDRKLKSFPINQAIAIELLHNFTLIHDDIMDNSDTRHNKQTVHKKYDLGTAILSGDALLAVAYEFLDKNLKWNSIQIYEEFTKALRIVCEGQALDKEFETKNKISLDKYFEMISMKTGALIKAALKIGALSTPEQISKKDIEKFGLFGEYLGIAFQIQDDLLDVVGDNKLFGKTKALDLLEGKKTYLLLKALELAKGSDLQKLNKLIENKGISPNELNDYIDIYKRTGVIELARDEISKYHKKASNVLSILSRKYYTDDLTNLLEFIMNRQY